MKKKAIGVIASATLVLAAVLVVLLNQRDDTCEDDVRGYERGSSSAIGPLRENINSIEARVGDYIEVPQLEGLSPYRKIVLQAIDTQCKILRRCVRFSYFTPPSEACPTEYTDYQSTRNKAWAELATIERIHPAAQSATQDAETLEGTLQALESMENTSGSTGGRQAILQAKATTLKESLSKTLADISSRIDGVISNNTKETDQ